MTETTNTAAETNKANDNQKEQKTMNIDETKRLHACEATIRAGLKSFYNVGRALAEIRGSRLYRDTHATFDTYAADKWDMTRARAAQLIFASHVHQLLSLNGVKPLPMTESQCRPLASIPETSTHSNDILSVWLQVIQASVDGKVKITAKLVSTIVDKFLGKEKADTTGASAGAANEETTSQSAKSDGNAQDDTAGGMDKEAHLLEQLRQAHAKIAYLESKLAAEKKAHQRTQAQRSKGVPTSKLAKDMFKAGFRVLAKQYHPDHGGDEVTMRELNNLRASLDF